MDNSNNNVHLQWIVLVSTLTEKIIKTKKMKKTKIVLLIIAFALNAIFVRAQSTFTWSCGNETQMQGLSPSQISNAINLNNLYLSNVPTASTSLLPGPPAVHIIPVVVHDLYSSPSNSISFNQIQWQIQALNIAFQNQYQNYGKPFGTYATNTKIQFCLAQNTPSASVNWTNNNEKGVMRYLVSPIVVNHNMDTDEPILLSITNTPANFPFDKYLNIYLVSSISSSLATGIQGYGKMRNLVVPAKPLDGVVMRRDIFGDNSFGNTFPLNPNLQQGKVLAHEVGHYFGLYHTFEIAFGGPCSGNNAGNCGGNGDLMCDTPPNTTAAVFIPCGTSTNSCLDALPAFSLVDQPDMQENFMNYSFENCWFTFTQDQNNKMNGCLFTNYSFGGRKDMRDPPNLVMTGLATATNCCPTGPIGGNFIATPSALNCLVYTFTNTIGPCNSNANYLWDFGDGSPLVNTSNSFTGHTYLTPGIYTVSCTASNAASTSVSTFTYLVTAGVGSKIVGISSPSICAGQYENIKLNLIGATSTFTVVYTNGITSNTITTNQLDYEITVQATTTNPLPYTQTWSVVVNPGQPCTNTLTASFVIQKCCNERITNGNFSTVNTGFTSDMSFVTTSSLTGIGTYYYTNSTPSPGVIVNTYPSSLTLFGNALFLDPQSVPTQPGNKIFLYTSTFTPSPSKLHRVNLLFTGGLGNLFAPDILDFEVLDAGNNIITSITGYTVNNTSGAFWQNINMTFSTAAVVGATPYKVRVTQTTNFGIPYDIMLDEVSVKPIDDGITINSGLTIKNSCSGAPNIIAVNTSPTISTFTWTPNIALSCNVCPTTTASPVSTTIYTVNAINNFGCSGSRTFTINVISPSFAFTMSPTQTVCAGIGGTLTAGVIGSLPTGYQFKWMPGNILGSTVTVNPASTTIYTLTITDLAGCGYSKTGTVQVNVVPFGTFTVTPSSPTICIGNSVTLNTTPLPSYSWTPIAALSCSNCGNPVANPTATTIYTVIGTNSIGCKKPITATVNVVPLPSLTVSPLNVCQGSTNTITASGASSYTWQPIGVISPSIVATTTAITLYTLTGISSFGCTNTIITAINPVPQPTITAISAIICSGQTVTIGASGATNYTWMPSGLNTSTIAVSPPVTTTYTVIANNGVNNCNTTKLVTVTVTATPSITLLPNTYSICTPGTPVTMLASGYPTFTVTDGVTSFTNSPTQFFPTNNTTYTMTAANGNCISSVTTAVNVGHVCLCTVATPTNYLPPTLTGTTILGGSWALNQDMVVNGYVVLGNLELTIAPGVSITVAPSSTLEVNNSHLYSCFDMWNGIFLDPKARFKVVNGSLIEDALVAVTCDNSSLTSLPYIIDVEDCVFNRNLVGIAISNYTPSIPQYPFSIKNAVFTSRQFTFTPVSWATSSVLQAACSVTNSLMSPYCLLNAPYNLCKPPAKTGGIHGVLIQNSGLIVNPTNTATIDYYEVFVGDSLKRQDGNLYDYLATGIYALRSSVRATNSIFQNMQAISRFVGTGILNDGSLDFLTHVKSYSVAAVTNTNVTLKNDFYDCWFGVRALNTFVLDVYGCRFFSQQKQSGYNALATYPGKYAVQVTTNRFGALNVSDNRIYNHSEPISFVANYGNLPIPSFSVSVGQYAGKVDINRNLINATNAALTTQYISNAITLQQPLNPPPGSSTFPQTTWLRIEDNIMRDVYRGIFITNWNNGQHPNAFTNSVTIEDDLITGSPQQYGISSVNSSSVGIYQNLVKGSGNLSITNATGIYTSVNNNLSVTCNTIRTIYAGFEFAGSQALNTVWAGNFMRNNVRGFVLSNSGVIGAQGSTVAPIDNQWLGNWAGNFHTWTQNSSALTSTLFIQPVGTYTPINNFAAPIFSNRYQNGSSLFAASGGYLCSPPPSIIIPGGGSTLDQIAQDSLPFVSLVLESQFIHKNHLFRHLKHNPSLMSTDVVLQNFYNTSLTGCREVMSGIEANLADGNTSVAGSQLGSFVSSNNIESNYKRFFEIYKAYCDTVYNANDSLDLNNLAYKCPFIDGSVVYQARALYNMIYTTVELFNDNCQVEENSSRIFNQESNSSTINYSMWTADLYPNPTANDLFITSNRENEELKVIFTDVSGKQVGNYNIKTQAYTGKLLLDLNSGIYFVTLINSNNDRIVKKLAISK